MSKKAANLYDWLMANLHRQVTMMTDDLFASGNVTQDERKLLSAALGRAMDAWDTFGKENFSALQSRGPYEPATPPVLRMPEIRAVKSLGRKRVGGYGILWGSEDDESSHDVYGEWFTPETDAMKSVFDKIGALPYLYNHAMDEAIRSDVIGVIDTLEKDEVGLWYEAQLEMSNKYREAFMDLTHKRRIGSSSGTFPGARVVDKNGQIRRWPVVEISGTPTPADIRHISDRPLSVLKSIFTACGLDFAKATSSGDYREDSKEMSSANPGLAVVEYELWALDLLSSL